MMLKLIIALVNPSITQKIIKSAKKSGATGDVIIPARGTGSNPAKFLGMDIEDKTDIVLYVVRHEIVDDILQGFEKNCNLSKPGNGIAIALSIDQFAGLESQIEKIKK